MTEKKKREPIKKIRNGDVTAEIYEKATTDGYRYYDFSLGRIHQARTHSTFHETSVTDLTAAANQASAWIKEKITARS